MRAAAFAVLGLLFGSFVTVLVHRLPRGESIVTPRSRCPQCETEIRAIDNIPVFSYLILRGRCRTCRQRISIEYPLTELATSGLFAGAALVLEPLFAAAIVAPFLGLMLALALIDARHRIIPNAIAYPALIGYAVLVPVGDAVDGGVRIVPGLIGLASYGGPFLLTALLVPRALGMGDAKLTGLIGLVLGSLGLRYVAVAAAAGFLAGGIAGVALIAGGGYRRGRQMPFGPFLAAGAVVSALAGPEIASAYLSLLG